MSTAVMKCLRGWLSRRAGEASFARLDKACAAIAEGAPERKLFMTFSAAPRHVGKHDLELSEADLAAARDARTDWNPSGWTTAAAGRALALLSLPATDRDGWLRTLDKLIESADVGEQIAFFQTLPLLPHPEALVGRCTEGLRTNITAVFRAIAHANPFPREQLSESAWNQMVLKALFVDITLAPIIGLDARANPALTLMLRDYARERRSAGRRVSPELWRCVALAPAEDALDELELAARGEDPREALGARLALARSPHDAAARRLDALGREGLDDHTWDSVNALP